MPSKINNQIYKPIHCPTCSKVLIKVNNIDLKKCKGEFTMLIKCGNCGKQSTISIQYKHEIKVKLKLLDKL